MKKLISLFAIGFVVAVGVSIAIISYLREPKTLAETIADSIESDTSQWKIVEYRDTIKEPKLDSTYSSHIQRQLYMHQIMLGIYLPQKIRIINKKCNILIEGELHGNLYIRGDIVRNATLKMITPQTFEFNGNETEIILDAWTKSIIEPREKKENERIEKIKNDAIAQHQREGIEIANKFCKK